MSDDTARPARRSEATPEKEHAMTVPPREGPRDEPGAREARVSADDPLEVKIDGGRLVISIGVSTLAYAVAAAEQGFKITNAETAAAEILRELEREEEDGTTAVHKMLDKAAFDAWENGGEGFAEGAEDD